MPTSAPPVLIPGLAEHVRAAAQRKIDRIPAHRRSDATDRLDDLDDKAI